VSYAPPALERLVELLDTSGPIEARLVLGLPAAAGSGRIGLLPGSFNPPTDAHVALAAAGRAARLDAVVYVLSKVTVNKEQVSGIQLADRLELLRRIAEPTKDGVAFANRGLYVDLVGALRRVLPRAQELVFLVGFDKIVQIFDPRYYDDRDAALTVLFERASFFVAPRGEADERDLAVLLNERANRRFRDRVRAVQLPEEYREASSTRVRRGEAEDVPAVVADYLERYRPFKEPSP
jgi:nicotinamide-nucleotide adenylyltransferase